MKYEKLVLTFLAWFFNAVAESNLIKTSSSKNCYPVKYGDKDFVSTHASDNFKISIFTVQHELQEYNKPPEIKGILERMKKRITNWKVWQMLDYFVRPYIQIFLICRQVSSGPSWEKQKHQHSRGYAFIFPEWVK